MDVDKLEKSREMRGEDGCPHVMAAKDVATAHRVNRLSQEFGRAGASILPKNDCGGPLVLSDSGWVPICSSMCM